MHRAPTSLSEGTNTARSVLNQTHAQLRPDLSCLFCTFQGEFNDQPQLTMFISMQGEKVTLQRGGLRVVVQKSLPL